jgi:hypothetical protein
MKETIPEHISPQKVKEELGRIGVAFSKIDFILNQSKIPKSEIELLIEAFSLAQKSVSAILAYMNEYQLEELD